MHVLEYGNINGRPCTWHQLALAVGKSSRENPELGRKPRPTVKITKACPRESTSHWPFILQGNWLPKSLDDS